MSDQVDVLFDGLRGEQPPLPFASAEAVRRRGRQRARRQATLAAVTVVAVTGLGAVAAATGGWTDPPVAAPPATGSPTPDTSPAPGGWLLTAADLGPGDWRPGFEPEWAEGSLKAWPWGNQCGQTWEPALPEVSEVGWTDGPWGGPDVPRWVHEVAYHPAGGAEAMFALVRDEAECAAGYHILEEGFAGDESILVQGVEPFVSYTVVMRMGDVVVTLRGYDPALGHADPDLLREVAVRLADRVG